MAEGIARIVKRSRSVAGYNHGGVADQVVPCRAPRTIVVDPDAVLGAGRFVDYREEGRRFRAKTDAGAGSGEVLVVVVGEDEVVHVVVSCGVSRRTVVCAQETESEIGVVVHLVGRRHASGVAVDREPDGVGHVVPGGVGFVVPRACKVAPGRSSVQSVIEAEQAVGVTSEPDFPEVVDVVVDQDGRGRAPGVPGVVGGVPLDRDAAGVSVAVGIVSVAYRGAVLRPGRRKSDPSARAGRGQGRGEMLFHRGFPGRRGVDVVGGRAGPDAEDPVLDDVDRGVVGWSVRGRDGQNEGEVLSRRDRGADRDLEPVRPRAVSVSRSVRDVAVIGRVLADRHSGGA